MDILEIEVLDPKANKYLMELADIKLITIRIDKSGFQEWLNALRSRATKAPSLEEIQNAVVAVRKKRYTSRYPRS